jgi:GT2 family glycosyltransferase
MILKRNPDISISIVNYNSFDYLLDCLRSISDHSELLDIEILITDNASESFDSSSIYQIFPDAIITCNKDNMGFAYAQNQNYKLSSGHYFLLLNPDTLITESSLNSMVDILRRFDSVAVVSPNLFTSDGKNIVTVKSLPTIRSAFLELVEIKRILRFFHKKTDASCLCDEKSFREVDCVDGAAFMVKTHIYDFLGGLDSKFFMYFEEVDFCKRLKKIGMKMYFLPAVSLYHMYGRSTVGTAIRQTVYYLSYYQYFRKHYGILSAMLIRSFILLGQIMRLIGVQIKYFPLTRGIPTYWIKTMSSIKLILWTLGIKTSLPANK